MVTLETSDLQRPTGHEQGWKIVRRIVISILVLGLVVLLGTRLRDEPEQERAPRTMRELTAEQLINRVERREEPLRLWSATDVLPGGYSAAMIPGVINWDEDGGRPGYVALYNVNHGGNPFEGSTVLRAALVPLEGVKSAEFTLLPLDNIGSEGLVQHGQLRFVFDKDHPVIFSAYGDEKMGGDPRVYDLVISWEAWRPPDAGFDVMTGMDPSSYLLGARIYSGPQRFLEDGLGQRDWFSYSLRMPGGQEGLDELFRVSLALCDGVARHSIGTILDQGIEEWARHAPADAAGWEKLKEVVPVKQVTDDPLINLPDADLTYQTLLRSCATMAYYTIKVAAERMIKAGHTDGIDMGTHEPPHLGTQEPWMAELATTNLGGVFLRSPAAVRYLRKNPEAFPKKIPGKLEEAGLLLMEEGKPVKIHYSVGGRTPYGTLKENLIR